MAKKSNRKTRLRVKKKFAKAIGKLKYMKPNAQRVAVSTASREFLNDISSLLRQIRFRHDLLNKRHKNILTKHKGALRKLVSPRTTVTQKRRLLSTESKSKKQKRSQRGGIIPALIPIIAAAIGAAGTIGASAVGAAVMKA